jgi:hypothetical protein
MDRNLGWYADVKMVEDRHQPLGFVWIGAFFVFGATMATYAAITLLRPGTFLDAPWVLNKHGHDALIGLGRVAGLLFVVLSALLALAAIGWFRRRQWGWALGVTIIGVNMVGDILNALRGEGMKGAVGVVIAGMLLTYMTRLPVRTYFRR